MRFVFGIVTLIVLPLALGVIGVRLLGGGGLAAPLAGAIFTTRPDGAIVNENVRYEKKIEVYLDGGPGPNAPQTAAGLPDGSYYFQVTDPSGKVLLSEDPAKCREVRVSGGVIVQLASIGRTYDPPGPSGPFPCSIQDPPTPPYDPAAVQGVAGPSGRHDTNQDEDHGPPAIVVQLMPFFDTPNPGGVYKAWMIPTGRYASNGGNPDSIPADLKVKGKKIGYQRDPGFGPPRDQVKTDNFKVKEFFPPEITVRKFHDIDGDGVWDAGEPEIGVDQCVNDQTGLIIGCPGGWPYDFTEPVDGGTVTNSFHTPGVHVAGIPGTYTACEIMLPGWAQTALYVDGVKQTIDLCGDVNVAGTSGEKHEIVFGDTRLISISGEKFIDYDADGVRDPEDLCPSAVDDPVNHPGCAGVAVKLDGTDNLGTPVHETTTTGEDGKYEFTGVMPGDYVVSIEEPSDDFKCSFPNHGVPCDYSLKDLESGDAVKDLDFGDFSLGDITGIKFFDRDGNGSQGAGESALTDWEIHLDGTENLDLDGDGTAVHLVTWTCGGAKVPDCGTHAFGSYWFLGLVPGDYVVSEVQQPGFTQTAPPDGHFDETLTSDEVCTGRDFGNFGPCEGLTPGYWLNWDNHYTSAQFLVLLQGTIAEGDIALAESYLTSVGCDGGDALACMRRFLLSDQLTLSLTQHPELPNPSGGSLIGPCQIPGIGTLSSAISDGLAVLADPGAFTRDEILAIKARLAAFATV